MRTSDFNDIGHFYRNINTGSIVFLTLGEETVFQEFNYNIDVYKKIPAIEIFSLYIPKDASFKELYYVALCREFTVPVFTNGYKFLDKLCAKYEPSTAEIDAFPATEVCKAQYLIKQPSKLPTEQRLKLCDVETRKLRADELPVSTTLYKNTITINPITFDDWITVLRKAYSFRTTNRNYLLLKSIFDLK